VFDHRETELPKMGMVRLYNKETDKSVWVDTFNRNVRDNYRHWWTEHERRLREIFKKNGIDNATIRTDEDYVKPLVNLFKERESRFR